MKFRDSVLQKYPEIQNIPSGYKRLGNFVFLRYHKNLTKKLGHAIIDLLPWCEGVFQYLGTHGENRRPELIHLAGSTSTIIEHKENKVRYIFDFSTVMFSGGNSKLRKDLVKQVQDNEILVDMFSAVGNLSLQVLKYRNIYGYLIEKDPITYSYLQKTVEINSLKNVSIINKDCRETSLSNIADRIFMGYHDVNFTHLSAAVAIAKEKAVIHTHPIAKDGFFEEWIDKYQNWFHKLETKVVDINIKKVKDFSPGLVHIEMTFTINKCIDLEG